MSPDGRWLAYVSDETGHEEIYARPFPGPGRKIAISSDGGREPVWSPNSDELFYRHGRAMMRVSVDASSENVFGQPEILFEGDFMHTHRPDMGPNYDVGPGARRFLMIESEKEFTPTTIGIVLDWFSELERLGSSNE